jgi:uncharacterized protein (TIGR02147 family)
MLSVYDYLNYRNFLKDWIQAESKKSKGIQTKLAAAAGVSSTLISRILSGSKNLTSEQANEMAEYFGFNDVETRYFILLVEIERAGTVKLKNRLLNEAKSVAKKVSVRIANSSQINEEIKSVFYSSWIYSGIRNLVATPGPHDVNSIANKLGLPKKTVANAVEFLVANNLCSSGKNGIQYASSKTHIDFDSPYINNHHRNWRHKGLHTMENKNSDHLFFSSPMSLSKETAEEIRLLLSRAIEDIMKKTGPSPSEVTYCLNLDWFEY